MGALNKHLFLPVNPPVSTMLLTWLSQGTQHPLVSAPFFLLSSLHSHSCSLWQYPPSERHLYTDIWNTNKETRTRRGGEDYRGLRIWQLFRSDSHAHNASSQSLHSCTNICRVTVNASQERAFSVYYEEISRVRLKSLVFWWVGIFRGVILKTITFSRPIFGQYLVVWSHFQTRNSNITVLLLSFCQIE